MDTQLTQRGTGLVLLTVGCVLLGGIFGARSLNAVVAPALVALVAAVVTVRRAPIPAVERTTPPDGHPEETHAVALRVRGCGYGLYALRDQVDRGIAMPAATFDVDEDRTTVSYDVRYRRRGINRFGPVSVTVTDVLGLAERQLRARDDRDRVLVYPELVEPPAQLRSSLETVVDLERRPGRDEFDRLREYDRGDSLRDVHWKSSAKRPRDDLVVKEFLGTTPTDAVRIGVSPSGDRETVDAAARAAASVAITLLEEGIEVGLETPRVTVPAGVGAAQREAILAALARLGTGETQDDDATIRITSSEGSADVHVGGRTVRFEPGDTDRGEASTGTAASSDEQTGDGDDRRGVIA